MQKTPHTMPSPRRTPGSSQFKPAPGTSPRGDKRRSGLPGLIALLATFLLAAPAHAWEVGEFRHGMTRAEVDAALQSWHFDRSMPVGPDSLFVYDGLGNPAARRFLFTFCNDRLVAFEQEVTPAFRHFVIIASNYANLHGDPYKIIPYTSVVASGEKNLLAMFWRKGSDFMGVKYVLQPTSEQLTMTWQIGNNCWQAPR